ncbi:MAG: DUF2782 domain-containing protein [Chromatiales bacterium]|nr:DUF2782 domain-containing protein [Chromatiales bacterium]
MKRLQLGLVILALGFGAPLAAQDQQDLVPPLPPQVQSGEEMEPDVTIIDTGRERIEEYRLNGQLYMVKVKPYVGPAYYFVDTDGDGYLETRKKGLGDEMTVQQWILFSW